MTGIVYRWAVLVTLAASLFSPAHAGTFDSGIPEGWACEGSCGTGVVDGVVTLAPSGAEQYGWVVTTASPLRSLGLPGIGGTNGSRLRSPVFSAGSGESLEFQFNYITSDGAGFADYAWARLLDASMEPVALLFTARTRSSGDIVPGFGMPEIGAEITPETVNIIGGGPRWSPLGGDSGRCYASGCGYTDWVNSRYVIPETGDYVLEFGVVNWSDTAFQSGLAFDGVMVGGKPIGAQPQYRDPEGAEIWREEATPGVLLPGALQEVVRPFGLGLAAPGHYRVLLVVRDAEGLVAVTAETSFQVLATSETGAGLWGEVSISPEPALRSETLYLHAEITNDGNSSLHGLPATLSLIDPAAGRELASWSHTLDLDQEETRFIHADWRIDAPAGTTLVAVLRAEIRGEPQTLASASIRVEDRFVSSPTVEGRGRLLVLLDPPGQHECLAVEQLELALPRLASLGYGDLLQLDLYDANGYLLDSESLRGGHPLPSDLSQGAGLNLILQDLSTQGMIVAIDFRDGRALQTDRFQLIATFYEGGFVRQFTSGMVLAGCADLPDTGDVLGDFRVRDAAIVAEGPSLRRRAFLEALLDTEGWSYTVVTHAHAFAHELRTGGYGSFLLLAERVKLDNQVTRELREAVFAGRGIVQAAARDHRNHHLLDVFGAEFRGVDPHAIGIRPVLPVPIEVPDDAFAPEARAVVLRLHGGTVIGEYRNDRGQTRDTAALAVHDFGSGRSLLAGFDLLAAAMASGASGGFAALLRDALEYTRPDPVIERPGMAIPMRWVLVNRGNAGSVRLDLAVIGGDIVDPGSATVEGPRHIFYDIDLPAGGQTQLQFWWRLPMDPDAARIMATLYLREGIQTDLYDVGFHDLTIEALPGFEEVRALIEARLELDDDYRLVLQEVESARLKYLGGDANRAVFRLLKAADRLAAMDEPGAEVIREAVAWLIHALAR